MNKQAFQANEFNLQVQGGDVITKNHNRISFIQIIIFNKTLESIFIDFRRNLQEPSDIIFMEKKEGTDSNRAK
ncbi:hypothetical protein NUSPORA_01130 [Nucleospora cyclopteri]